MACCANTSPKGPIYRDGALRRSRPSLLHSTLGLVRHRQVGSRGGEGILEGISVTPAKRLKGLDDERHLGTI